MSKVRADDKLLGELHRAVGQLLLAKVSDGSATAAEISAAIRFLADNKIELDTVAGSDLEKLAKALPNLDPVEDEVTYQ